MRIRAVWLAGLTLMVASCGSGTGFEERPDTIQPGSTDSAAASSTDSEAVHKEPPPNPVAWSNEWVRLEADDFRLVADGVEFLGNDTARVWIWRGDSTRAELVVQWQENGVRMALDMVFEVVGNAWHCAYMHTYDGQADYDNIWYTGPFFESPLGRPFTGSLTIPSDPPDAAYPYAGEIRFVNLRLSASFKDS